MYIHTRTTLTSQTIYIYMYQQTDSSSGALASTVMSYSLSNVKQDTFVVARILAVRMESLKKEMNK